MILLLLNALHALKALIQDELSSLNFDVNCHASITSPVHFALSTNFVCLFVCLSVTYLPHSDGGMLFVFCFVLSERGDSTKTVKTNKYTYF